MKNVYLVSEIVDEDGGFGDAVETTVPLAIFADYHQAEAYVKKYSKAVEYDDPYMPLCYGELKIDPVVSEPNVSAESLPNYEKRTGWNDDDEEKDED